MLIVCGGFFYVALIEARKSTYVAKLGALAICKGTIVGKGFNKIKRHANSFKEYGHHSIHAEMAACFDANTSFDTLFIVRLRRDGKLGISKPCDKCERFIRDRGVKRVIYINWDGALEEWRL